MRPLAGDDASLLSKQEERATTQQEAAYLERIRAAHQRECAICGTHNPTGLRLSFRTSSPGRVEARFLCDRVLRGYPAMLHGGVAAAILDDAMANCLFSLGTAGYTGELVVRYLAPVALGCAAEVHAELTRSCDPMHYLTAELRQEGKTVVQAFGKFVDVLWTADLHNVPEGDEAQPLAAGA